MRTLSSVKLGLFAVLLTSLDAYTRVSCQNLIPQAPPPLASSLEQLAKSPASALLANDFFAQERLRARQQVQPQAAAQTSLASVSHLATSGKPQYSAALTLNGNTAFRLDQYHNLEDIYGFIDSLARRYRNVHVFTIGQTGEGRPLKALEIIQNATDPDYVWLDAVTHAREWITASTLLHIVDQLVAGSPNPSAASNPFRTKNFIIIPVVNPDGYAYTWTTNRMWRKNRSRSPGSKCIGADLNRNFDHSFGGEGASSDPCSHIYSGAFPFSEPETRALADLMWSLKDRIKFYLTLHSFNQLWAAPYAHSVDPPADFADHMRVLRQVQRAVLDAEGVHYEIGPLSTSLYVGSGFGIDFAYDKCHIKHSYLVELRDKGQNGFVLPPDQIMPTARETLAGLKAGLRAVFASQGGVGNQLRH